MSLPCYAEVLTGVSIFTLKGRRVCILDFAGRRVRSAIAVQKRPGTVVSVRLFTETGVRPDAAPGL